jgi:hypothetical protein
MGKSGSRCKIESTRAKTTTMGYLQEVGNGLHVATINCVSI